MNYSKYIDHTLLKTDAKEEDIRRLCEEAKQYDFCSVCINPSYVKLAKELLAGSDVKVCTVIGFPLGQSTTETKVFEALDASIKGADEIDMVLNVAKLKDNDVDYVTKEIQDVKNAIGNKILKVIIETCLLTDEEKVRACNCILNTGADFVKTSTGFSTGGATLEDVALLKRTVGNLKKVKAAGGIKTKDDFMRMIGQGAVRIGTSNGTKLI